MKAKLRTVAAQSPRRRRERVYALLRRSHRIYSNRSLRHKWVRARLTLGATAKPKMKVGLEQSATFPRTTAEATKRGEFTALAPRTMREAGLKS